MVPLDQLVAFSVVALVLIAIPGPSVVFTIGRALAYGRAHALATVVGNSLGLLTIVFLVAFGLGTIIAGSILAFTLLKLGGAAYLVWLGIRAIRDRRSFTGVADDAGPAADAPQTLWTSMRQGYVVGVSNPKAFVIIGVVLPQFVDRSSGHLPAQLVVLGLVAVTIGLLSDSLWAVIASQLRTWFLASRRRGESLGLVGGLSMVGLGVTIALTGRAD